VTIEEYITDMNDRTSAQVSTMQKQNKPLSVHWGAVLLKLPAHFVRKFVLERGFHDGNSGFTNAMLSVLNMLTLYAKIWEGTLRRREEKG
jgi:hypothetical protein